MIHIQNSNNLLVTLAIAMAAFTSFSVVGSWVQPSIAIAATPPRGGDSEKIPIGDSHVFGSRSAPVAVVAFLSMQCPFSARSAATIKELQRKYPNDVKLVFKHFPLESQAESVALSKALIAAGRQGKFWAMQEKIFEDVAQYKGADVKALTSRFAEELGLKQAKYQRDFDNPKNDEIIKRDQELGKSINVRGTPHFMINGERIMGAQPLEKFEQIVVASLQEVKKHRAAGVAKNEVYRKMVAEKFEAPKPVKKKAEAPRRVVNMVPVRANDPMKGNTKDYLVTIVAFVDFQCPFSKRVSLTLDKVLKSYGKQVRIVFKSRPHSQHKEARSAHIAALAAHEQGKFWEMHDLLFANAESFKGADIRNLTEYYALKVNLNSDDFRRYRASGAGGQIIKEDLQLSTEVGVRGTPDIFINGVQFSGALPYEVFEEEVRKQIALAKELKKKHKLKGEALYKAAVAENKKSGAAPADFVKIPAGRFTQGSPSGERGRSKDEVQRNVTISRAFWLQSAEVTQTQWQALMGYNPSYFKECKRCPVEYVSWFDAVRYLNRLSEREGLEVCYELSGDTASFKGLDCGGYRLPTEAEWEYAARAGTTGEHYGGIYEIAWSHVNSSQEDPYDDSGYTNVVRGRQPNAWGLYDMLGNVWEWTGDWYGERDTVSAKDPVGPRTGSKRVIRGCSSDSSKNTCRAATRGADRPTSRSRYLGFRPARTIF